MEISLIETIILQAPNVAVAIAALFWASRTIERMINAMTEQNRVLLTMIDRVIDAEERATRAGIDNQSGRQ